MCATSFYAKNTSPYTEFVTGPKMLISMSAIIGMLIVLLPISNGNAQDSLFNAPMLYAAGYYPNSIFTGDLDNDGYGELAVTNYRDSTVSIYMNNGDGSFRPKEDYYVGEGPVEVCGADLDSDGDMDLAIAGYGLSPTYSHDLFTMANNGDGSFQSPVGWGAARGTNSVVAADFNGDGYIDLSTTSKLTDSAYVYFNNGNGAFALDTAYWVAYYPSSIKAADFDFDNDNDLAISVDYNAKFVVFRNIGNGHFLRHNEYSTGNRPFCIVTANFDSDSLLDLATCNYGSNNVSVFINQGDCAFNAASNYPTGILPQDMCAADFDLNGFIDIATANNDGNMGRYVSILFNRGSSFASPVFFDSGNDPEAINARDLDQDGDFDLIAGGGTPSNIAVLINHLHVIGIKDDNIPRYIDVLRAYPNPFNSSTTISFELTQPSQVTLAVYNLLGQRVVTIFEGDKPAGMHKVVWNAECVPSGTYFARMTTDSGDRREAKLVLVK